MLLEGKTALITGGTSGIGLAVAQRFLREGAVVMVAGRNPERCQQVVAELASIKGGGAVHALPTDVSCSADVKRLVAESIANLSVDGGITA